MYIGERYVTTNVERILENKEFYNSKDYLRLLNICTDSITHWVKDNESLISTLRNNCSASYGTRQIAYADCRIGTYIGKIQRLGLRVYERVLHKQVTEALAEEYIKLPEFARKAYSLNEYAESFVDEHIKQNKNQINREISAHAYRKMRAILDRVI
jgi:hypothetical protein